jgi:PAS domain S-box-containing protein
LKLDKESFDVVVSDYQMPKMDGISFLKEVRARHGKLPFILFTGRGREEVVMDAVNFGADYYLQKGGDPLSQFTDMLHKIRMAYQRNTVEKIALESDRRFKKTLDQINMVAFHLGEDGTVLYCNDYLLNLTGWTREEFIGKVFFDLAVPPEIREMKRNLYREAVYKQTISQHEEMKILLRSGEIRDLDIVNTDLRDEKGRFLGYMCIGEDVTDRKRAREEIESWKRRYELLTALSGQVAYEYEIATDSVIWSDSTLNVLGYYPDELAEGGRKHWFSLVHPDDREVVTEKVLNAIDQSTDIDLICRFRHNLGHYVWIHVRGYSDAICGKSSTIIGIITDITREREAEIALRMSEERFKIYVDKAPFGVYICDRNGSFRFVNPAGEALSGYSSDVLSTMNIFDLAFPEDVPTHVEFFNELLEIGHIQKIIPLKGINSCIQAEIYAVLLPGGEVLGFCQDITEKINNEVKILEITKKLRLLQSITRHDIINSITSIRGYLYLLTDMPCDGEEEEFHNAIVQLLKKIEDLITFSRQYEKIGVHCPSWQNVYQSLSRINTSGILVHCLIPEFLEIYTDPMLDHVFSNLYHNSYNHGCSVSYISCSMQTDKEGITLIWEDDGKGIDYEEKEKIFELGYGKNTGFGLYLISEILAITGITIRETGKPGEGARFEMAIREGLYRFEKDPDE